MTQYIILLFIAIIVLPIAFVLSANKTIAKAVPFIALVGTLIAFAGIFISRSFPFYYTVLIMFGLAFAFSVLVDKRQSSKKAVDKPIPENKKDKPQVESELEQFVKMEETAATIEEDDFIVENPVDEDLKLWMSDDLEKEHISDGEEVNRGK